MNEKNSQFLGKERIGRLMLKFSIPCVLSLLVSALYNIVDQIFIGNSELSALGNAATGVVFPIFIIAQAFAWCFGDGCAAYLNICQGQKNTKIAQKAIGTGITVTLITSIILIAFFYPLETQLLTLFGASENSIGMAIEYFNIILAFFPLYMLSNMMNAVVRADGSPSWSMASMLIGAVVNIILDPLFIFVFQWGMTGAAVATVIGQSTSFIISFLYFFRTKTFQLNLKNLIPDFRAFSGALKLGASSFITQMTIVIISLCCNIQLAKYGAMSQFGADIPIAIIGIESKVFTVIINIVVGIVLGCQPIIGYNIGAGKFDRVRKLYKNIFICTAVVGLVSTLLFEFAPNAVVALFGSPTNIPNPENYWLFAEKTFRIFLAFVTFTCMIKMTSIFFQAVGKPIHAIVASLVRDIVCFIPLIMLLPAYFGIEGILFAAPGADLIAMMVAVSLTVGYFRHLGKIRENASPVLETTIQPSHKGVIVTVARQHGSCGKRIAQEVAKQLGVFCYYKEMTALAAQESGLDRQFVSELNENAPSVLHALYLSTTVIRQAITAQAEIIKRIADAGSCVIVGRAADYVLGNHPDVVRIFIYAPKECRIKNVMEMYGDTEEEARKNIRHSDEARGSYYNTISNLTWGDRNNYDLLMNASAGIENCSRTIAAFVRDRLWQ